MNQLLILWIVTVQSIPSLYPISVFNRDRDFPYLTKILYEPSISIPIEENSTEEKPIEEKPVEEKPIEEKPIEEKHILGESTMRYPPTPIHSLGTKLRFSFTEAFKFIGYRLFVTIVSVGILMICIIFMIRRYCRNLKYKTSESHYLLSRSRTSYI